MTKKDIMSMTLSELSEELESMGAKKYAAGQIFSWLHEKRVGDFDKMTDISKSLREELKKYYIIYGCGIEKKLCSVYDNTVKYLFRLHDGELIETVVMKYKYGYTVCVSSQVGCKMGCNFCASGIAGFVRNLTAGEILSQVYKSANDLNIRISHVVMMGVGEPLDNYDNAVRFIRLITDEKGMNLSARSISLSTCGVVPGIYKLMNEGLAITLSVSLHAPNDEIRSSTMPVNSKWNIDELLRACREYAKKTSRRISFEYAMISGVNDSAACAEQLLRRLAGMLCHVNLIAVNPVKERSYRKSTDNSIKQFAQILSNGGITVTVRRTLGSDINASCGQLRRGENNS